MRKWLVGGAVVRSDEGILLVQNRRKNGSLDWTPPGGVIDDGESIRTGLTREVVEETGLAVTEWHGPVWEVDAIAEDLGWRMRAEIHLAEAFGGVVRIDDPDGIVERAEFVAHDLALELLDDAHRWVREPLTDYLADPWRDECRPYRYRVELDSPRGLAVHRLDD